MRPRSVCEERETMKMKTALVTLLVLAMAACGADPGSEPSAREADAAEVGTLQLSLTGVDAQLQQYWLRAARFDIQGTRYTDLQSVSEQVFSDTELDSPVIRTRLFYGSYTVSLSAEQDWYIERLTPNGAAERVAEVVLLSSPTQSVFVQQGQVSQVAFQFGVDGELIDFVGGDLEIGIGIVQAPAASGSGE
jgi:hypothetical protein